MWNRISLWLTSLVQRARFDRDLSDELEFHLRARAAHWEERGLTPREAMRRARIEFGSIDKAKAQVRDVRFGMWVAHVEQDVRYGLRMLRKHAGFTAMAVLSLGIGIGANTTIFSIVNAVLLRPVPLGHPEELVTLYERNQETAFSSLSYPDIKDVRDGAASAFTGIAASTIAIAQIDEPGGAVSVVGEAITGGSFSVLGIEPQLGRPILAEDETAHATVVMLSHGFWQRRFGGDRSVLGRELRLNGRPYTIVGIAPAEYRGGIPVITPAFYVPMIMLDDLMGVEMLDARGVHNSFARARLARGVTRAQAETVVARVAASLTGKRPDGWVPNSGFTLYPTANVRIHPQLDQILRAAAGLLLVVVGLLLLLACTNLTSFMLARALDRRREVCLRLAVGATRGALIRQLLVESLLLCMGGGAMGLALAVGLLNALLGADLHLPYGIGLDVLGLDPGPNWNVLTFAAGISVLAGALLGLVPALQSTRPDVAATLKTDNATVGAVGPLRWRNALVIAQITVSLVLLVGAGLFLRSWQQMLGVDPGFGRPPSAILSIFLPTSKFTADEARRQTRLLLERFGALPGVEAVGVTNDLPLDTSNTVIRFTVDGHVPPPGQDTFSADLAAIDGAFFDAAGVALLQGRTFSDLDTPNSEPVAIVSKATALRYWPAGDAVGRLMRASGERQTHLRVVGVAGDVDVRTRGESPRDMIYVPFTQRDNDPRRSFVARTSADASQLGLTLLKAGREIDPDLRVMETKTMAQHLAVTRMPAEVIALVMSVFGGLGLGLAALGLYGVVSYTVTTRTREVGIRMALGARAGVVVRLLASQGMRIVLIGGTIGMALSLGVMRLANGLLFGVETFDPFTLVTAPVVLGTTACLAAYLPARRASRVSPLAALRSD
ncbi:MAG TPA: ABC transporter permease [Vicinamibacterales bacterium]|nr:ABC transporter permease [Vicinamibacterales bacterium]